VPGLSVLVASPEDILLATLLWFRMGTGTSWRQWSDVNHWAKELGVEDLLARP
jgi:hypothetical protein